VKERENLFGERDGQRAKESERKRERADEKIWGKMGV